MTGPLESAAVWSYADTGPPPAPPACTGLPDLFESIRLEHGKRALQLCAVCPALTWCRQQTTAVFDATKPLGPAGRPSGTWAGRFYGNNGGQPLTIEHLHRTTPP